MKISAYSAYLTDLIVFCLPLSFAILYLIDIWIYHVLSYVIPVKIHPSLFLPWSPSGNLSSSDLRTLLHGLVSSTLKNILVLLYYYNLFIKFTIALLKLHFKFFWKKLIYININLCVHSFTCWFSSFSGRFRVFLFP